MPSLWLQYVSEDVRRLFHGLPIMPDQGGDNEDFRRWVATRYIDTALASRDSLHSDFTNNLDPELPPSRPPSPELLAPIEHLPLGDIPRDAHWPHWLREQSPRHYYPDARLRTHVDHYFPCFSELLVDPPPNTTVSEELTGCWQCPACTYYFQPYNLTCDEISAIDGLRGWPFTVDDVNSGTVRLNTSNPQRFLRYIDALAWLHIASHLGTVGIRLEYPHPEMVYRSGLSWSLHIDNMNAIADCAQGAVLALAEELEKYEDLQRRRMRNWIDSKLLRWARRGLHRTAVNLTRLRRDARVQRADRVYELLQAGEDVVDVMHVLVDQRRLDDASVAPWQCQRGEYRQTEKEVLDRRI